MSNHSLSVFLLSFFVVTRRKEVWETVPGNCDTLVYLGGNEQNTHKYISEPLGKATIDKKTSGETKGRQGSSSKNYDVLGREIMTPDEVRKLDNKKCLLFIRGFDPILDNKYRTLGHPMFSQTADGEGKPYMHIPSEKKECDVSAFVLLNQNAVEYYEGLKQKGEFVYIDTISYEDFMLLGQFEMEKWFMDMDEQEQRERLHAEEGGRACLCRRYAGRNRRNRSGRTGTGRTGGLGLRSRRAKNG